jgi:uncharacterized protein
MTAQIERTTLPTYAPVRNAVLYLTDRCNLACSYCFQDVKSRNMSSETMRQAIDFILSGNISGAEYRVHLTFFGGEPFTRLDLMEEAVAYARKPRKNVYKKIEFSATTNGTVVGPRVERLIRDTRMSLLVSMDGGVGAASHRPFVSGRSSYGAVARNLRKLVEWSPDVVVRTTFHPGALDLAENVRHLLSIGAPSIALCPVEESDWAASETRLEEEYQALALYYIEEAKAGRLLPLEITHRFLQLHHATLNGAERPERPCDVGSSLIGIDPEGHVMPCHRFLYRAQDRIGHVSRHELEPNREAYVRLSSRDILGCETCEARKVCGGGCRATAVAAGSGLFGTHPGYCVTARAHVRAVRRIYQELRFKEAPAYARMLTTAGRARVGALGEFTTR